LIYLNEMKVSIITVSFNSVDTILHTIKSVHSQTHKNIEHIIVDGQSSDGTISIIQANQNHNSKWISEPDSGIYDAMNKGLGLATGNIIGILNADDLYADDNAIEAIVKLFKDYNCDCCYADLVYVERDNLNKVRRKWKAKEYKRGKFFYGWMPPHPTFFVKKDVYDKYGKFKQDLGTSADYEIMLRFIHKHNIKVEYLSRTIVKMRVGGASNASLLSRLKANFNDRKAWKVNNLEPRFYTLLLKPLRKLSQFIVR
jgi:glycosyltransferase involved in cell wall biosynthesis